MRPDMSVHTKRWIAGARSAWPLLLAVIILGALAGYELASYRLQPLTPSFTFTSATDTIEVGGSLQYVDNNIPNATNIFCSFSANGCQIIVAELVPASDYPHFQVIGKLLNIIQLSDASLTAMASSSDPCQAEVVHIDRTARVVTLATRPSGATHCEGTPTKTATLGD
jgi:hypothetical protein